MGGLTDSQYSAHGENGYLRHCRGHSFGVALAVCGRASLAARAVENRGVRFHDRAVNFVTAQERIRPRGDHLIIKPLPLKLGARIDADWRGDVVRGEVIAAGPGCYPNLHSKGTRDGKPYHTIRQSKVFRATEVKPGDVVELGGLEIGGYLWPKVWAAGDWCVIAREQDVAVLHETDWPA